MPRLFTGLEIPHAVVERFCVWRGGLFGARWIEPDDYHLTLKFIGDIDIHAANDFAQALQKLRQPPVVVTLESLAVFGGARPHALVAKAALTEGLASLHARHEALARQCGLAPESRKYTPHVTLARLRQTAPEAVAAFLEARGAFQAVTFEAPRFVLYSTRGSTGGGPYCKEAFYPLSPVATEGAKDQRARGWAD